MIDVQEVANKITYSPPIPPSPKPITQNDYPQLSSSNKPSIVQQQQQQQQKQVISQQEDEFPSLASASKIKKAPTVVTIKGAINFAEAAKKGIINRIIIRLLLHVVVIIMVN
jgi:hypothetical protein